MAGAGAGLVSTGIASTFRLTNGSYNGAELSPKIYASGWGEAAGLA
jgi:hypothetical protein